MPHVCNVIYYIGVLGPLGRREHSELRAAKPHAGISSQHFSYGGEPPQPTAAVQPPIPTLRPSCVQPQCRWQRLAVLITCLCALESPCTSCVGVFQYPQLMPLSSTRVWHGGLGSGGAGSWDLGSGICTLHGLLRAAASGAAGGR
jgi:hypothetical protein